ncbi:MAG: hypothetical protein PHU93_01835 [Candidatus Gracilibacteria bacterium]|nr:hypothetical protein [Candidatus Gracilibacteria bacterium]
MSSELIPIHSQHLFSAEKTAFIERILPQVPLLDQALVRAQITAMNEVTFATMLKESGNKVDTIVAGLRLSQHMNQLSESIIQLESKIESLGGTVDQARKRTEALSKMTDQIAIKNISQPW